MEELKESFDVCGGKVVIRHCYDCIYNQRGPDSYQWCKHPMVYRPVGNMKFQKHGGAGFFPDDCPLLDAKSKEA
jgi:hypothetical protein